MKKNEDASGPHAHVRGLSGNADKKRTAASSAYTRRQSGGGSNGQEVGPGGIYLPAPKLSGSCHQGQATAKGPGDGSSLRGYSGIGGSAGRDLVSVLGLVGLARKAGKLLIGEQAVRIALDGSQVHLLLLAEDSSSRTKRNFAAHATAHNVPLLELGTKTRLGFQLGRKEVAVAAIIDQSLAHAVLHRMESAES